MKQYKRLSELSAEELCDKQPELVKEILYNVWLMETHYPDDGNAFVILLDGENELVEVEKSLPILRDVPSEIDERTWCDDARGFHKIVWVLGQDGSGIVVLYEVRFQPTQKD